MEIAKIRVEINKIKNRKIEMKLNETKSYFFEKSNKIDKPLASLKCFCTVDIFQDPPQKISHVGSLTLYGVNFMNESSEII